MGGAPLHRLGAGPKLALLAAAGTLAFFVSDARLLLGGLLIVLALHALARIPFRVTLGSLRASWIVLVCIVLAQGLGGAWLAGVEAALRLAALILLAALITLTSRQSDMAAAIGAGLRPLRRLGLDPEALALGLSLTLRFIPMIAAEAALVRDAQRARGLDRHPLALFVPLIVRVLKMADDLGEAIDARSGGPD